MSTRGLMGVRIDGTDKLMYNHHDSYPSGLGWGMILELRKIAKERNADWLKERAKALRLVDGDHPPTEEEQKLLAPHADLGVSERTPEDWYCLLRNLQGELEKTLEAGFGVDSHGFIEDSLFCEWGYIVNLDDNKLEVYKGWQHHAHDKGRYAKQVMKNQERYSGGPYYPCALVAEFPLDALPDRNDFLKALGKASDEE